MWKSLARFVLKFRIPLLILMLVTTAVMGYFASKVKLSYEFSGAIPTDNPKYLEYQSFRQKFGDDGNVLVAGITTDSFFTLRCFTAYTDLQQKLKATKGVDDVLSVPSAINLVTDTTTGQLAAEPVFSQQVTTQAQLDSEAEVFKHLPFYSGRLYNAHNSYLMAVRVNKEVLASKARSKVIADISARLENFTAATQIEMHVSGLPLIRTVVADRVQHEMKLFLFASLLLSLLILLAFFRSFATTVLSLSVVLVGVVWTVALIYLCGYKITLLTALIPSLVVVIGIPNCIYFLNKYHSSYLAEDGAESGDRKTNALITMVSKMGIVTLFCNLTAAIGFGVFAFTKSEILKQFGVVAGLSILLIFVVSFILLPAVLSFIPAPGTSQLKYLKNRLIDRVLTVFSSWVFDHRRAVLAITGVVIIIAGLGTMRLKTVAHIVDDLPTNDRLYTDLKYFEKNFSGVMPLEVMIDTKKPFGILSPRIDLKKIEAFEDSALSFSPDIAKPLSVVDGIKFSYQGLSGGSDSAYALPAFGSPLIELHKSLRALQAKRASHTLDAKDSAMMKLTGAFVDSSEQDIRISASMADVGTIKLPLLLSHIQSEADKIFDSSYKVTLTGTSITFLEGSKFIINGLRQSIIWAFVLIAFCMLFLFSSVRILICSLIPNMIPLLVTAGVMGWTGVPLKPSTVLVFSVALGIAVDITIRFLVNYKQVLPANNNDPAPAVKQTLFQTGLSIIYTSIVLTAGFIIFCASSFGGTFALGWLTSVTLFTATITNLVLLPVLLIVLQKKKI